MSWSMHWKSRISVDIRRTFSLNLRYQFLLLYTLDPAHLNKDVEAKIGLIGDAGLVLDALLDEINKTVGADRDASAVAAEIAASHKEWLAKWMPKLTHSDAPALCASPLRRCYRDRRAGTVNRSEPDCRYSIHNSRFSIPAA